MGTSIIFAGDVGGTKTYLAAYSPETDGLKPLYEQRYTTRNFQDAGSIVIDFISKSGYKPQRVVLGVPGPVRQLPVRAVNLPWSIDPVQMKRQLEVDHVNLLNDLQATSYGTQALDQKDLCVLNKGIEDSDGNIAVIAAGTGLGEGGLVWSEDKYISIASEGGHSTFSPNSDLQQSLACYLRSKHGHVSWERVVSGPGLVSIYDYLRSCEPEREPSWLSASLAEGDQANIIADAGLKEDCDLAQEALDLFVYLYGCEAGNLALKLMATGGVYVGGGIAPKILPRLLQGSFIRGFLEKGRMGKALESIPVHVILNDKTALLGAAFWGSKQDSLLTI